MGGGSGGVGDPSPLFSRATVTTSSRQSSGDTHSESIVHRLNHLSLLINSSGIDLNIALNESVYESAETSLASESSDGNSTLASLSSRATKRRSLMPQKNQAEVKPAAKPAAKSAENLPAVSYMGKDGLLDAFLTLYDECCTIEKYKKDPLVQQFIKKCKFWFCSVYSDAQM